MFILMPTSLTLFFYRIRTTRQALIFQQRLSAKMLSRPDTLVLLDEAYYEFSGDSPYGGTGAVSQPSHHAHLL